MHSEFNDARGVKGLNARYQILEGAFAEPHLNGEGAILPSAELLQKFLGALVVVATQAEGMYATFHIDHHAKGGDRHMLKLRGKGLDIIFCENAAKGLVYQLNEPRRKKSRWDKPNCKI